MPEGKITEHFTWSEAACNCCRKLPADEQVIINTAQMLEKVRAVLGNRPISINSWYRCSKHNRRVGGARNSQHLKGYAVDFTVAGLSPAEVQEALRPYLGRIKGPMDQLIIGGLGRYGTFTHVDRRTNGPVAWKG